MSSPGKVKGYKRTAFQEGNRITKNSEIWGRKGSINIELKASMAEVFKALSLLSRFYYKRLLTVPLL